MRLQQSLIDPCGGRSSGRPLYGFFYLIMTYEEQLLDPRWEEKKQEVFEYYGAKCCYKCMSTKRIEVHHKLYYKGRMAWEYDVWELLPLCHDCHSYVHDKIPFTQPYESIKQVMIRLFTEMLRKRRNG